jgi:hypothetical protein
MSENNLKNVSRQEALAKKKSARLELHLQGFGNKRFPECSKEMSEEQAARALNYLAKAGLGV